MGTNFTVWIYKIPLGAYISSLKRKKRQPAPIDDMPPEFLSRHGAQENGVLSREIVQEKATRIRMDRRSTPPPAVPPRPGGHRRRR